MQPRMSDAERDLFAAFLQRSNTYLEFGSGGSTAFAAHRVGQSIISVDSSEEWQRQVADYCATADTKVRPELVRIDIGPIGDWGYPADESCKERWAEYHTDVWRRYDAAATDLFLVDGRFRVACFMQVMLHCEPDAFIVLHDFASRPQYHVVLEVAREVARAEDLSVFQPMRGRHRARAAQLLRDYALVTS